MTIDRPKFCIHTVLQLVGLTTEKLLPMALKVEEGKKKGGSEGGGVRE